MSTKLILIYSVLSYALKIKDFEKKPKALYEVTKEKIELVQKKFKSKNNKKVSVADIRDLKLRELAKKLSKELKFNIKVKEGGLDPIDVNLPNPLNGLNKVLSSVKKKITKQKGGENENLAREMEENSKEFNEELDEDISLLDVLDDYAEN